MAGPPASRLLLPRDDKRVLRELRRTHSAEARYVRRARILLYCERGVAHEEIARRLETSPGQVRKWRRRYEAWGLEGVLDLARSGRPPRITPREQMSVLGAACRDPVLLGEARTLWSHESLARVLVHSRRVQRISATTVGRLLRRAGLKPHKVKMWCTSTDPLYDEKLADITRLYIDPPAGEPVLSIDEKTGMQALSRSGGLRRREARGAGRLEFEYRRNGTRCLFACLNVRTGQVLGRLGATRTAQDFLSFLDLVAGAYRQGRVHIVLDNLNTHHGEALAAWNRRHGGRFVFHYTPTHGSWLNQVEIFFGILSRRVLRAASYGSTRLLDAAVTRFLAQWNEREAHPFRWTYRGRVLVA